MTRKTNLPYEALIAGLKSCKSQERKSNWSHIVYDNISPLVESWEGLSHRQKIKALKDKRWNHYPLSCWTSHSPKKGGDAIEKFVRAIVLKGGNEAEIISNHSVGIFAIFAIDMSPSKIRIEIAKRHINSKDARLRGRCAKILPIRFMKHFINDKNYGVKSTAIKRIGFDNCYDMFIPTKAQLVSPCTQRPYYGYGFNWLSYQAIRSASLEEIENLLPLIGGDKLPPRIVEAVLEKISREDILYYLNEASTSKRSANIIQTKLK